MKRTFFYILCVALNLIINSCAYDNYDAPDTYLKGRIVYRGEPANVSYNDVSFELWEPGWQKKIPINVIVAQDGSFSTVLFNATYKLIFQSGQGPFTMNRNDQTNSDTLLIVLKGSQTLDIEVTPYYMVRNTQFSSSGNGTKKISATCSLEKIITDANAKDVEKVSLYISKTQFVDGRTSIANQDIGGGDITDLNAISLSVDVPAIVPSQNYVFARVGVKINGVEDMIFSPVQKVEL
jgi:hypothetical protein